MKFWKVVKGKLFVALFAGLLLVGGVTVAFAQTTAGHHVNQSSTSAHRQSAEATTGGASHKHDSQDTHGAGTACPGLPEAQHLASAFSMSTDSTGAAVQAICALHQGTFKGTTPTGRTVTSSRVFGYGEIEMLLTYAHYLATHGTTNSGGKMSGSNVSGYLAQALQSCGTTPLGTCLKTNIPGFQPGTQNGSSKDPNGNQNSHKHGKPTGTPTPPPHH